MPPHKSRLVFLETSIACFNCGGQGSEGVEFWATELRRSLGAGIVTCLQEAGTLMLAEKAAMDADKTFLEDYSI